MKIFPSVVHEFRSNAERKVYDMLLATDLGPNAFALHSLNLSKHEYKRWAELDFVVVWEDGIYALEIKGGRVSCQEGIWSFTNRFDETSRKSEGPFEQAKTGHEALREILAAHADRPALGSFCWGWGVVFPDIEFDVSSVSWSTTLIADRRDLVKHSDLGRYLNNLAKWWRARGRGHRALASAHELAAIRQALRPDFDKVKSIGTSIDQAFEIIVRLTDEQIQVLDAIDDNDRILCIGGAGTGKSFLALEAARREAVKGKRTILLCRSPIFAGFLRGRIQNDSVTVAHLDSLESIAASQDRFDMMIVDEAQDFLSDYGISVLDAVVAGGLESGSWRMFLDPNNQSGLHEAPEPDVLRMLQKLAFQYNLKRNCRNTEQIVLETQLLTGADIGIAVIEGSGPPIEINDVNDREDAATALDRRIESWLDDGVHPGHITILSPNAFTDSSACLLPARFRSKILTVDADIACRWPSVSMTFSTILDFKGLENRCIAIIDLDPSAITGIDIAQLYVAMTRAHAGLWLSVPKDKRPILNNLIREHTVRLLEQGGRS
ncbi:MAG: NERD domain-containing protein [Bacteroidia bacterium]|nr:NERD domain-containing protein [Bacteroidia bacterium]